MSKAISISSAAQFSALLASSAVVVADFYADWCGPCKQVAPIYENLAAILSKEHQVTFTKINTDSLKELASQYSVTALPTFIVFKNGQLTEKIVGADVKKLQRVVRELVAMAQDPNISSSSRGGGSGGGDNSSGWRKGNLPRGYADVTDQVDVKGLELLNSDSEFGSVRVLFDGEKPSALAVKGKSVAEKKDWVESDTDAQLMLFLPFQAMLKVHTLQITSLPPADSEDEAEVPMRPKSIHLYANRPHILGFEEAEDIASTQTITLSAKDWDETGTATVALRFVKFQNITSLVIFFVEGDGDGERVRIDRLRIIGETGEKRDQGQLKKVEDE